jgi:hypothetical protein
MISSKSHPVMVSQASAADTLAPPLREKKGGAGQKTADNRLLETGLAPVQPKTSLNALVEKPITSYFVNNSRATTQQLLRKHKHAIYLGSCPKDSILCRDFIARTGSFDLKTKAKTVCQRNEDVTVIIQINETTDFNTLEQLNTHLQDAKNNKVTTKFIVVVDNKRASDVPASLNSRILKGRSEITDAPIEKDSESATSTAIAWPVSPEQLLNKVQRPKTKKSCASLTIKSIFMETFQEFVDQKNIDTNAPSTIAFNMYEKTPDLDAIIDSLNFQKGMPLYGINLETNGYMKIRFTFQELNKENAKEHFKKVEENGQLRLGKCPYIDTEKKQKLSELTRELSNLRGKRHVKKHKKIKEKMERLKQGDDVDSKGMQEINSANISLLDPNSFKLTPASKKDRSPKADFKGYSGTSIYVTSELSLEDWDTIGKWLEEDPDRRCIISDDKYNILNLDCIKTSNEVIPVACKKISMDDFFSGLEKPDGLYMYSDAHHPSAIDSTGKFPAQNNKYILPDSEIVNALNRETIRNQIGNGATFYITQEVLSKIEEDSPIMIGRDNVVIISLESPLFDNIDARLKELNLSKYLTSQTLKMRLLYLADVLTKKEVSSNECIDTAIYYGVVRGLDTSESIKAKLKIIGDPDLFNLEDYHYSLSHSPASDMRYTLAAEFKKESRLPNKRSVDFKESRTPSEDIQIKTQTIDKCTDARKWLDLGGPFALPVCLNSTHDMQRYTPSDQVQTEIDNLRKDAKESLSKSIIIGVPQNSMIDDIIDDVLTMQHGMNEDDACFLAQSRLFIGPAGIGKDLLPEKLLKPETDRGNTLIQGVLFPNEFQKVLNPNDISGDIAKIDTFATENPNKVIVVNYQEVNLSDLHVVSFLELSLHLKKHKNVYLIGTANNYHFREEIPKTPFINRTMLDDLTAEDIKKAIEQNIDKRLETDGMVRTMTDIAETKKVNYRILKDICDDILREFGDETDPKTTNQKVQDVIHHYFGDLDYSVDKKEVASKKALQSNTDALLSVQIQRFLQAALLLGLAYCVYELFRSTETAASEAFRYQSFLNDSFYEKNTNMPLPKDEQFPCDNNSYPSHIVGEMTPPLIVAGSILRNLTANVLTATQFLRVKIWAKEKPSISFENITAHTENKFDTTNNPFAFSALEILKNSNDYKKLYVPLISKLKDQSIETQLETIKAFYKEHFKYEINTKHPNSGDMEVFNNFIKYRRGLCAHFSQFAVALIRELNHELGGQVGTATIWACESKLPHEIPAFLDQDGRLKFSEVTPSSATFSEGTPSQPLSIDNSTISQIYNQLKDFVFLSPAIYTMFMAICTLLAFQKGMLLIRTQRERHSRIREKKQWLKKHPRLNSTYKEFIQRLGGTGIDCQTIKRQPLSGKSPHQDLSNFTEIGIQNRRVTLGQLFKENNEQRLTIQQLKKLGVNIEQLKNTLYSTFLFPEHLDDLQWVFFNHFFDAHAANQFSNISQTKAHVEPDNSIGFLQSLDAEEFPTIALGLIGLSGGFALGLKISGLEMQRICNIDYVIRQFQLFGAASGSTLGLGLGLKLGEGLEAFFTSNHTPSFSNDTLSNCGKLSIPLCSHEGTQTRVNVDSSKAYSINEFKGLISTSTGINPKYIIHQKGEGIEQNPKVLKFSKESIVAYNVINHLRFNKEMPEGCLEARQKFLACGEAEMRRVRRDQKALLLRGIEVYLKKDNGLDDELVVLKLNSDQHLELVHSIGTGDEVVEKLDKLIGATIYDCHKKANVITLRLNNPKKREIHLICNGLRTSLLLAELLFSDNGLLFGTF